MEPSDPLTHGDDHDISDIHSEECQGEKFPQSYVNEANVGDKHKSLPHLLI